MVKTQSLITPRPRSAKRGGHHSSLSLKAPAKINWFLHVYSLRKDGYHDIKSLIQKISLYDVLTFEPSKDLTVITDARIQKEENLVYKAGVLLRNEYRINMGAEIHLYKNIPVAAGLGGGSSDAALTLIGLNKLWSLELSTRELCGIAEQLGSDVPFFLYGPLALVEGRGEKITPIKAAKKYNLLLVKPHISISTKWAYGQLKHRTQSAEHRTQNTDNPPSPPFSKGGKGGFISEPQTPNSKLSKLTKINDKVDNIKFFINAVRQAEINKNINITNDLESVTAQNFPVVADIKERLNREGAIFSIMSGSGPTVFGVFTSVEDAENASKAFKEHWTAVVQTLID
jgi:4-diphosphocytidyl-2-C-methyl-D-erythritol kinase